MKKSNKQQRDKIARLKESAPRNHREQTQNHECEQARWFYPSWQYWANLLISPVICLGVYLSGGGVFFAVLALLVFGIWLLDMTWVRLTATEIHIYRLLSAPRRYRAGALTYRLRVSCFSSSWSVRSLRLDSTTRETSPYELDLKSVSHRCAIYDAVRRMGHAATDESYEKKAEELQEQVQPTRWQRSAHAASLPMMTGGQQVVSWACWVTAAGILGIVADTLGVVKGWGERLVLVLAFLSILGALVLSFAVCKNMALFSALKRAPRRAEILQTLDLERGLQANAYQWSDEDIDRILLLRFTGAGQVAQLTLTTQTPCPDS